MTEEKNVEKKSDEEQALFDQHEEFLYTIQSKLNESGRKIVHNIGKTFHMMQKGIGHEELIIKSAKELADSERHLLTYEDDLKLTEDMLTKSQKLVNNLEPHIVKGIPSINKILKRSEKRFDEL
eukprot:CAMPEP_0117426210 /NCGR_PEP_ID=MMETSP0758-20121206/6363_1 /TAXON_ID=63605 /ORGANISM="Percolomonas cosmopolitus, Strain AE-1 (ATCC 50343)" /LENGTH=123 /DNA_ID=CAMNT_0005211229 /DNA_START=498 /DNA_END=866 /DNA_ORIENTATION=-